MRCPLHDEYAHPETGVCDHCERDARLDCTDCDGVGVLPCVDGWGAECSRPCHCQPGIPPGWGLGADLPFVAKHLRRGREARG